MPTVGVYVRLTVAQVERLDQLSAASPYPVKRATVASKLLGDAIEAAFLPAPPPNPPAVPPERPSPAPEEPEAIGVQLKRARESSGLGQRALAHILGVERARIDGIERGRVEPSGEEREAWIRACRKDGEE